MRKDPTEHQIQSSFVRWLRLQGILGFAIPNGGYRHITTAMTMRREGALAGVPDIFIAEKPAESQFRGLFLEFKAKRGRLSPAQEYMFEVLRSHGFAVVEVRSVEQAIEVTKKYLKGE